MKQKNPEILKFPRPSCEEILAILNTIIEDYANNQSSYPIPEYMQENETEEATEVSPEPTPTESVSPGHLSPQLSQSDSGPPSLRSTHSNNNSWTSKHKQSLTEYNRSKEFNKKAKDRKMDILKEIILNLWASPQSQKKKVNPRAQRLVALHKKFNSEPLLIPQVDPQKGPHKFLRPSGSSDDIIGQREDK